MCKWKIRDKDIQLDEKSKKMGSPEPVLHKKDE